MNYTALFLKFYFLFTLLIISCFCGNSQAGDNLGDLIDQGNSSFERGDYEKAIDLYEQGLKASPKEAVLYYNKANSLYRQEKFEQALELFQEAIKNNPVKILLKNIYFNTGNTHFKLAQKKSEEEGEDIETLKQVLADYEKSFMMYRKSLNLDRKLSIAEGRDIHQTGIYAKQNWALSRQHWTRIWEKIRELEKKNLKLEDSIRNLLQGQADMLPSLERVYLGSFSEDSLKFNLKTLGEFHLDYKEDISYMLELAAREVEKIDVEIENYKSDKKQAQTQSSGSKNTGQSLGDGQEPELEKLEKEKLNLEKVQEAVNKVTEFEEWIVDSLKRTAPIPAWKNSRQLIDILQDLDGYLKKLDIIHNNYISMSGEINSVKGMLEQARTIKKLKEEAPYKDVKSRLLILAGAKLESIGFALAKVNVHLENIKNELDSRTNNEEQPADIDAQQGKQEADPNINRKQINDFFKKTREFIVKESIIDLKKRNEQIRSQISSINESLKKSEKDIILPNSHEKELTEALIRYLSLQKGVEELFVMEIKETQELMDSLAERKLLLAEDPEQQEQVKGDSYVLAMSNMEVLIFKYNLMVKQVSESSISELEPLKKALPENLELLKNSWNKFNKQRNQEIINITAVENLNQETRILRQSLLRSLLLLAPDMAIAIYYDYTLGLNKKLVENFPSTIANRELISRLNSQIDDQIIQLTPLLEKYFSLKRQEVEKISEQEKAGKAMAEKSLKHQEKAVSYLKQSSLANHQGIQMLNKDRFLTGDLLLKEAGELIFKSGVFFQNQPDKAPATISMGIKWQEELKIQSRAASEAVSGEGEGNAVKGYLENNQNDVLFLTGLAISQIRAVLSSDVDQPQNQQGQGAANNPAMPQQGQEPDPATLEEAISYLQEALIEEKKNLSFFKAGEFDNTIEKHEQILELLKKALDAINKKKDQEEQGKQCKNPQENQENQEQQDQQGQDEQQKGQQGQQERKPLELSPEEASALLNQLNREDKNKSKKADADAGKGKKQRNTPRPW
jgi:hypothetical protein